MESGLHRLSLNDLSTVHEQDERLFLDHSRKYAKLNKYKESKHQSVEEESGFDFDDDFDDNNDFDNIVQSKINGQQQKPKSTGKNIMRTPISNNFITMSGRNNSVMDKRSISSTSSRTSSSIRSQYTESDTDNSDYAQEFEDFEDFENDIKTNLLQKFRQKQEKVRQEVERTKHENLLKYSQIQNRLNSFKNSSQWNSKYSNYVDDYSNDEDFEDFNNFTTSDFQKLSRFNSNPNSTMGKKKSMPVLKMGTSLNGSPKKIKKYASTLDINNTIRNQDTLKRNQLQTIRYPLYIDEDDLDDIQDMDRTITLADYKKLQRKMQNIRPIDLSKFSETPSSNHIKKSRHSKHHKHDINELNKPFLTPQTSKTSQLTKEGKIRLIRSLGKPKVKKTLPAHLYGELSYDPFLKKWCGNDEDLARFESINYSKPKLISKSESIPQSVNGMVYDDTKLRWVSVTGSYEDDPFGDDFDDTVHMNESDLNPINQRYASSPHRSPHRSKIGRLVPSESTMTLSDNLKVKSHFKVTPEMYKVWKNEEERWIRKVGNWFPDQEDPHTFKYDLKVFLNQQ